MTCRRRLAPAEWFGVAVSWPVAALLALGFYVWVVLGVPL